MSGDWHHKFLCPKKCRVAFNVCFRSLSICTVKWCPMTSEASCFCQQSHEWLQGSSYIISRARPCWKTLVKFLFFSMYFSFHHSGTSWTYLSIGCCFCMHQYKLMVNPIFAYNHVTEHFWHLHNTDNNKMNQMSKFACLHEVLRVSFCSKQNDINEANILWRDLEIPSRWNWSVYCHVFQLLTAQPDFFSQFNADIQINVSLWFCVQLSHKAVSHVAVITDLNQDT